MKYVQESQYNRLKNAYERNHPRWNRSNYVGNGFPMPPIFYGTVGYARWNRSLIILPTFRCMLMILYLSDLSIALTRAYLAAWRLSVDALD